MMINQIKSFLEVHNFTRFVAYEVFVPYKLFTRWINAFSVQNSLVKPRLRKFILFKTIINCKIVKWSKTFVLCVCVHFEYVKCGYLGSNYM